MFSVFGETIKRTVVSVDVVEVEYSPTKNLVKMMKHHAHRFLPTPWHQEHNRGERHHRDGHFGPEGHFEMVEHHGRPQHHRHGNFGLENHFEMLGYHGGHKHHGHGHFGPEDHLKSLGRHRGHKHHGHERHGSPGRHGKFGKHGKHGIMFGKHGRRDHHGESEGKHHGRRFRGGPPCFDECCRRDGVSEMSKQEMKARRRGRGCCCIRNEEPSKIGQEANKEQSLEVNENVAEVLSRSFGRLQLGRDGRFHRTPTHACRHSCHGNSDENAAGIPKQADEPVTEEQTQNNTDGQPPAAIITHYFDRLHHGRHGRFHRGRHGHGHGAPCCRTEGGFDMVWKEFRGRCRHCCSCCNKNNAAENVNAETSVTVNPSSAQELPQIEGADVEATERTMDATEESQQAPAAGSSTENDKEDNFEIIN